MIYNLVLSVVCLVTGVAMLVWFWINRGLDPFSNFMHPGILSAWGGVVLGLYNFLKWRIVRSSSRDRAIQEKAKRKHPQDSRFRTIGSDEDIRMPEFDFSRPIQEEDEKPKQD